MRYSPAGDFLAIGCKNGSLVIMAVEKEVYYSDLRGGGGPTAGTTVGGDAERHRGPLGDAAGVGVSGQEDAALRATTTTTGSGSETAPPRSAVEEMAKTTTDGDDDVNNAGGPTPSSPSSFPQRQQQQQQHQRKAYRRVAHLKGHSSRVLHVDWTVDGRFVHSCGQDYHILHWEILPPPSSLLPPPDRRDEGAAEEWRGTADDADTRAHDGDDAGAGETVPGQFQPRIFKRAFLVRDEQWATWSSTIGWPVQV